MSMSRVCGSRRGRCGERETAGQTLTTEYLASTGCTGRAMSRRCQRRIRADPPALAPSPRQHPGNGGEQRPVAVVKLWRLRRCRVTSEFYPSDIDFRRWRRRERRKRHSSFLVRLTMEDGRFLQSTCVLGSPLVRTVLGLASGPARAPFVPANRLQGPPMRRVLILGDPRSEAEIIQGAERLVHRLVGHARCDFHRISRSRESGHGLTRDRRNTTAFSYESHVGLAWTGGSLVPA